MGFWYHDGGAKCERFSIVPNFSLAGYTTPHLLPLKLTATGLNFTARLGLGLAETADV